MTDATKDASDSLTTLSGTSDANSLVFIFDGKTLDGVALANASGNWSFKTNVTGGSVHSFSETAIDPAVNIGSSTGVTLYSASANSILKAGTGNDVLIGGHNDTLTGGTGVDNFVFNANFGKNAVSNFNVSSDSLTFAHGVFSSVQQVLADTHDVNGNAVITLDAHDTITLDGIKTAQLISHQSDIHLL
jgi:Ca2+-binding RTX toxin-like protein